MPHERGMHRAEARAVGRAGVLMTRPHCNAQTLDGTPGARQGTDADTALWEWVWVPVGENVGEGEEQHRLQEFKGNGGQCSQPRKSRSGRTVVQRARVSVGQWWPRQKE